MPKCLFVGTAKAGTTTLEHALRAHPQVAIPRKETFFFDHECMGGGRLPYPMQRDPSTVVTSAGAYKELYAGHGRPMPVEIGTGYLYHHRTAVPGIKQLLGPGVRIGMVLRDPVERAWSSYMHFVKDTHEQLSFRESLAQEQQRRDEGWDFMWHHVAMGMYARQVAAYIEAFPDVGVFFFEDLRDNGPAFMQQVFRFLGLEPISAPRVAAKNPSGVPKYRALQRLITTDNAVKRLIRPVVRAMLPEHKRSKARKFLKEKNLARGAAMAPADRLWLRDTYAKDVSDLSGLLGQDLYAKWRW